MKLHAFRDRLDDDRKSLAAHHALDVYRIVSMMTRAEHHLVQSLSKEFGRSAVVSSAAEIVRDAFVDDRGNGVLQLRAGATDAGLSWSNVRSDELVSVLEEVFPSGA